MPTPERPNILLIIPHDLGDHLGCYGHDTVRSPSLDQLAAEGVRLTHCFNSAAECTPSRGGLYTGYYSHQNGLMGLSNFGWRLRPETPHLAQRLHAEGYETLLFGLQHETHLSPAVLGYNTLHSQKSNRAGPVCDALLDFLKGDQARGDQPWFACAGFFHVHRVWSEETTFDPDEVAVPPYLPDNPTIRQELARFHQDILDMDTAVGPVLQYLRESDLGRDTLIIFTTDHGCGFPRAKATYYDPGIRVPMILNWPGHFEGGREHDALTSNLDLTPTLLELCGGEVPADMEGKSFLPVLRGRRHKEREAIYGSLFYDVAYDPMHCVRTRTHKYIRSFAVTPEDAAGAHPEVLPTFKGGEYIRCDDYDVMHNASWESMEEDYPRPPREELYDLRTDPLEQDNLAGRPEAAKALGKMRELLHDMMERTSSPLLRGHVAPPPEQLEASRRYRPGGPMYEKARG